MLLGFKETKQILSKYNLALKDVSLFNNKKEALDFAKKIGFPVVLKVYSEKVIHKTEKQGVVTDIDDEKEFKEVYKIIDNNFKDKEGIIVQKQFHGHELVIGAKRDQTFGPVVMIGLGGIFVELLKDVSFGVCPIKIDDAKKMINDFKGHEILKGFRNGDKCKIDKLAEMLVNISDLMKKEVIIADFRIIYE
jgi:acetyl-CoA synthetase (ADP-forming)